MKWIIAFSAMIRHRVAAPCAPCGFGECTTWIAWLLIFNGIKQRSWLPCNYRGATDTSKGRFIGSNSSSDKCMDAPSSTCSVNESCTQPDAAEK